DQFPPGVVRVPGAALRLEMLARRGHRRAVRDRLEQSDGLARLVRTVVLGLALVEPVVVEQRLAALVARPLVRGDAHLGEQAVLRVGPGALVDPDETLRRIAGLFDRDRAHAIRRLINVPDALIDVASRRRGERTARNERERRARTKVREESAP